MSDAVSCPYCDGTVEDEPELAGQDITCPHCKKQFVMPDEDDDEEDDDDEELDDYEVTCPHCRKDFLASDYDSVEIICPYCHKWLKNNACEDAATSDAEELAERVQQIRKSKPGLFWTIVGVPAALMVFGCFGVCSGPTSVKPAAFKDDPGAFKGKEITMTVYYSSADPIRHLQKVYERSETYEIYASGFASFNVLLSLDVPTRLDVPALEDGDTANVTFRCTKGSTSEGNIVMSLRRYELGSRPWWFWVIMFFIYASLAVILIWVVHGVIKMKLEDYRQKGD